jgi:peptidoglycan/LPS O-acetylase OafA/YrhL
VRVAAARPRLGAALDGPGGGYAPWFLNAGRAVAFTAGCLFVAGALLGFGRRGLPRESIVAGGNLALGAAAAMAVVLAVVGPGTLYPLALALGAGVCLVSGAGGAFGGSAFRTIFGR